MAPPLQWLQQPLFSPRLPKKWRRSLMNQHPAPKRDLVKAIKNRTMNQSNQNEVIPGGDVPSSEEVQPKEAGTSNVSDEAANKAKPAKRGVRGPRAWQAL